jgi:hypothetical protein
VKHQQKYQKEKTQYYSVQPMERFRQIAVHDEINRKRYPEQQRVGKHSVGHRAKNRIARGIGRRNHPHQILPGKFSVFGFQEIARDEQQQENVENRKNNTVVADYRRSHFGNFT